jgi:hypothetical protein
MSPLVYRLLSVLAVLVSIAIAVSFEFNYLPETKQILADIDENPPRRIEPIPVFELVPPVVFPSIRDPFRQSNTEAEGRGSNAYGNSSQTATSAVRLAPEDLSLLGLEAEHALIKLPDGAVYQVKLNDSLWNGEITVQAISNNGVTLRFSSGEVSALKKISFE